MSQWEHVVVVVVVVVVGRLIYLSPGVESGNMCMYTCLIGKVWKNPMMTFFMTLTPGDISNPLPANR